MNEPHLVVLQPGEWTPQEAADYVTEAWQSAVGSIVETGRRLIEAQKKVGHGNWLKAIRLMPFGEDTAQLLQKIAEHPDLSNTDHGRYLPPSWRTLTVRQNKKGLGRLFSVCVRRHPRTRANVVVDRKT